LIFARRVATIRAVKYRDKVMQRSGLAVWSRRLFGLLGTAAFLAAGALGVSMVLDMGQDEAVSAAPPVPTAKQLKAGKDLTKAQRAQRARAVVFMRRAGYSPVSLADYYVRHTKNRRWRMGFLRTVRGTMEHRVRHLLPRLTHPTLLVVGGEDRIVNPSQAVEAARMLPNGKLVVLPRCGHAPQIEESRVINRLVAKFLRSPLPRSMVVKESARSVQPELAGVGESG